MDEAHISTTDEEERANKLTVPDSRRGCGVRNKPNRYTGQIPWLRVFVEGVVIVGKVEN